MPGPDTCEIIGRWRIVKAEIWDRKYLDLAQPAYLKIGNDGRAEFTFGVVEAGGEIEYGKSIVFFRWHGADGPHPPARTHASESSLPSRLGLRDSHK